LGNGDGGYGKPRSGLANLPFNIRKPDDQVMIVLFKVNHPDPELRQRASNEITQALKGIIVGGFGIHPVITNQEVDMTSVDAKVLAKQVLPDILKLLNLPQVGLGDPND
jgi:hypothetical protein